MPVSMVELSQDAVLRVPEEARKILPSHAQQATTYFSGGDFFNIVAAPLSADTRFAEHFDEPMTGAEIEIAWRTLPALGHEPRAR
jgi:hypothetical protein